MGLKKLLNIGRVAVASAALYCSGCDKIVPRPDETPSGGVSLYTKQGKQIILDTPERCALELVNYALSSQERLEKGMAVLKPEIKRGWLSPKMAKEAKELLEKGLEDFHKYATILQYIHSQVSRFRYKANFRGPVIRQEIVSRDSDIRVPYPKDAVNKFDSFIGKYGLKDGVRLERAIAELEQTVRKEKQTWIEPHRYLPFCGYNERIDELVHPDGHTDLLEGMLGFAFFSIPTLVGIFYIGRHTMREKEEEIENKKREEELKQKLEIETSKKPEKKHFQNPFEINLGDEDGS